MKRREFIRTAAVAGAATALVPAEHALGKTVPPSGGAVDEADGIPRPAAHPEEWMGTADARVDVRIRFAGLCMFVPDRISSIVHVLLPNARPNHVPRLHWRRGRAPHKRELAPRESLVLGAWGGTPPQVPAGIFDIGEYPATCAANELGKVDLNGVQPGVWVRLRTGSGAVINPGGRWKLGNPPTVTRPMPTVVDWWMRDVPLAEIANELVVCRVIPHVVFTGLLLYLYPANYNPVLDLWLLNIPADQGPGDIGEIPFPPAPGNNTYDHFAAFFPLLKCPNLQGLPEFAGLEPWVPDPLSPWWPLPPWAGKGMLVDCGVTKATPA